MTRPSIARFSSSLCAAGDESTGAWAAVVERQTVETQSKAAQRNSVDARIVNLAEGVSVTSIELRFRVREDCCIVRLASDRAAPNNDRFLRLSGGLGLVRRFLLLCVGSPGRNNSIHTRVCDRLTQLLAHVTRDHEEGSALRGFASKHFLRFIYISVAQCENGFAEMSEGVLQALHSFGFVACRRADGLEVHTGGWLRSEGAGNTIIRRYDVGENLPDGPHTFRRTPVVLVCRNSFGKARVARFIKGDLVHELGACPGGKGSGSGWRSLRVPSA